MSEVTKKIGKTHQARCGSLGNSSYTPSNVNLYFILVALHFEYDIFLSFSGVFGLFEKVNIVRISLRYF